MNKEDILVSLVCILLPIILFIGMISTVIHFIIKFW